MEVRALTQPKKESAIRLARTVFLEFEAPDYPAEGAQDFFRFIDDPAVVEGLAMYGVYLGGALTGMIATRSGGTHISLFFVDKRYHRMGIGRKLFEAALSRCPADAMTIHSPPCAADIYRKFGFRDTGAEQMVDGIRFIPMRYERSRPVKGSA